MLQALYSLSGVQGELQLRDRPNFMRFVGLTCCTRRRQCQGNLVLPRPDQANGRHRSLFRCLDEALPDKSCLAMGGQMIDAALMAASRQKLTIKEGHHPGRRRTGGLVPHQAGAEGRGCPPLKRSRARLKPEGSQHQAIQIAVPAFGYKSYIGVDRHHGQSRRWTVTDTAEHDSRSFRALLDPENTTSRIWADTAYRTKHNLEVLERLG